MRHANPDADPFGTLVDRRRKSSHQSRDPMQMQWSKANREVAQRALIHDDDATGSGGRGGAPRVNGMPMHSLGTRIDHSWRCPRYCVTPVFEIDRLWWCTRPE